MAACVLHNKKCGPLADNPSHQCGEALPMVATGEEWVHPPLDIYGGAKHTILHS